jgi:ATP-dependent Clp protease ATP-binding subunit ClpC
MMPHLNPDADAIVKLANTIAHEYEQEYVGTEHILLAILDHDKSAGAAVLKKLGLTAEKARLHLADLLEKDKEDTWVFGRLPGSPHFKNVMALAIDEATQLESREIGSEHLLLALLREDGSAAQRVLAKAKITLDAARKEVLRHLGR